VGTAALGERFLFTVSRFSRQIHAIDKATRPTSNKVEIAALDQSRQKSLNRVGDNSV
jgi:hypothetical protein